MNLRLAIMDDLPKIKMMYQRITENMNKNNIQIWDNIYPCEFLDEDIKHGQLYVIENNHDIVASFALCPSHLGENYVQWTGHHDKVLYIDRLGVNVDYLRQGIGSLAIKKALFLARQNDIQYIRLFVVDINQPAIQLYLKNGFKRVEGIYDEVIDDGFVLHEYGFEMKVENYKGEGEDNNEFITSSRNL